MNKNNENLKIAVVAILFLFIGASAVQAVVLVNPEKIRDSSTNNEQIEALDGGSTFTWEDDFLDWSKIDTDKSSNIDIVNNKVIMKHTCKAWKWNWPKMKEIQIQNSGSDKTNYVFYLDKVYHTPEMESDYSDLRFVAVINDVVTDLDYWVGTDYSSSSAEVWVRIPQLKSGSNTIYMFYGATAPWDNSNYEMIFRWDDRTDPDVMISYKNYNEGAWDPDVAYGGGRFLVAWEERVGPEDMANQGERALGCCIHGRTYDYDGKNPQPSGDSDIDITPAQPPDWSYHAQNPSIAYGDGKFFVAWEENPASLVNRYKIDIKGALVTTSGSVTRLTSPICSADNIQGDPCVAYGNNKFFVAWEDARASTNNYDVWGRVYSTSGSPATSEFQITTGANYEGEPWVCADDDGSFMVVYEKGDNPESGPFSIYAQKFYSDGGNAMTEKLIASGTSSEDYIFPAVSFNPSNGGRYLISWNSGQPGPNPRTRASLDGKVMGKIINKDGTETSNFNVQPGDHYIRTDVVPFLGDMFFVVYDGSTDLWGKLVYSEDIKTAEQALSDGSSQNIDWNNLAVDNEHDRIMAVWEDERDVASQYADAFGSVWHIYKSSGTSDVSYSFGSPQDMYTNAVLMSKVISSSDVQQWQTFESDYNADTASIDFDVMNSQGTSILHSNLGDISNVNVVPIRLRAKFSRELPNADPNIDSWKVTYIGIDNDPPTTELYKNPENPDGDNQWYISAVEISLLGLDGEGSGVETNHYILDGGSEEVGNSNPFSFRIYNSGAHTIEYWSVDYAGNIGQHKTASLKIDTNSPNVVITQPEDGAEIPPGDIAIVADVSEGESGINKVQFYLNGELQDESTEDKETYYFSFFGSPAMWYRIQIKAYDKAGKYSSKEVNIQTQSEDKIYEYFPKIGYWYTNSGSDDSPLLLVLSCSLVITRELDIKIKPPATIGDVDHVKFEIRGKQTYEGTEYAADSDGFFKFKFDPPTWFYSIKATMFDSSGIQIEEFSWSGKVIFINTL